MSLSDFVVLAKIGEGAYSSVHKVRRLSDNNIYALKKVQIAPCRCASADSRKNKKKMPLIRSVFSLLSLVIT